MKLTIANKEQLDQWINERRKMNRNLVSIKGKAPNGATYSDGDPIINPINVAWQDMSSGEIFTIEYEV
jgi:hypothetical protein